MKKTVIISGASGYVGKNFIKKYKEKFNIIGVVRDKSKLVQFKNDIVVLSFQEFLENSDITAEYLLNLAFPRKSDIDLILQSFDFTYKLLDKSLLLGVDTIINISSQSVYDKDRKQEAYESDPAKPFNLYGIAKIYLEEYFRDYAIKNEIHHINLRIGSIIGEGFDQRFINKYINSYLNDEDIEAIDSDKRFSFLDINDACEAFANIIESDSTKLNGVYNIGAKEEYTIKDIIKSIQSIIDYDSKSTINIVMSENSNSTTNKINTEKIEKELGWYSKINLDNTIENIWRSYEK